MGVVFTTRGWTGAQITLTNATHGAEVYAVDGDEANALEVAEAFASWIVDGARAWSGDLDTLEWGVIYGYARVWFWFEATGTTFSDIAVNAAAEDRIGVSLSSATEDVGTTRGSCGASVGMVMTEPWDLEPGFRNRTASFRMGHPTFVARRPSLELALDQDQLYAMSEALRIAAQPRVAYIYDERDDTWRRFVVGRTTMQPHREDDVTKYSGSIEALGVGDAITPTGQTVDEHMRAEQA